jgi:hypothetical protein
MFSETSLCGLLLFLEGAVVKVNEKCLLLSFCFSGNFSNNA